VVPEDLFRGQIFRKGANKLKATEGKKCIRVPRKIKQFIGIYDKILSAF